MYSYSKAVTIHCKIKTINLKVSDTLILGVKGAINGTDCKESLTCESFLMKSVYVLIGAIKTGGKI